MMSPTRGFCQAGTIRSELLNLIASLTPYPVCLREVVGSTSPRIGPRIANQNRSRPAPGRSVLATAKPAAAVHRIVTARVIADSGLGRAYVPRERHLPFILGRSATANALGIIDSADTHAAMLSPLW